MHLDEFIYSVPIIVGLIGIALAVFERGYKRYLEAKKENPELKFESSYIINILISSGGMATIIGGVMPVVIEYFGNPDNIIPITILSLISDFGIGYLTTYRILDGLNNMTDDKKELALLRKEIADTKTK